MQQHPARVLPSAIQKRARVVLIVATFAAFSLTAGCKKDENETPQTTSLNSPDTGNSTADTSETVDEQAENSDDTEEADPIVAQQVRQEVRSPSPDERAYNVAEIRQIRERLGLIPPQPLDIEDALRKTDIRQIADYSGKLTKKPMEGTLPSRRHNAYRLATDEGFGFSVEVWTFPSQSATNSGFEEFRTTLIAGTPLERATVPTTLSVFAGIRQLIVKDAERNAVVSVSCSESLCTTQHLEALAERVRERL